MWFKLAKQTILSGRFDLHHKWLAEDIMNGVDVYRYTYMVPDFLGMDDDNELELYEIGEQWLNQASKEEIEKFQEWLGDRLGEIDPYGATETHLNYEGPNDLGDPSFWKVHNLVHFTSKPWEVSNYGFKYGHEDIEGLALTTWKKDREKHPGYNFAFSADNRRDMFEALHKGKYGSGCVFFRASAVPFYHYGDEERQMIFWGPSVSPSTIFPVEFEHGEFTVKDDTGRTRFKSEDASKVAEWLETNEKMLNNIRCRK